VRGRTRALDAPLSPEDCALQSMPDASPAKWHLGHTTWFFETFVVTPNVPGYRAFDPSFRVLFNSYYHAVGERHPRPERGMLSRPPLDVVLAYRAHVDDAMRECCERAHGDPALASLIELGLAHEEQHQELILTDVLHLFSRNPLYPAYDEARKPVRHDAGDIAWIRYRAGLAAIGHGSSSFAFDNETPRHRVWIEPFTLASRPVSNAEFLAFVEDGGYRRAELWLSLGFDTASAQGWSAPLYWIREGDRWREFTLRGLVDLDPHAPVTHISFFEADAYARWAGARLPTEFEWEAVASRSDTRGHDEPIREGWRTRVPSTMSHGEVWEWTLSSYAPYPGFHPAEGAIGEYNGKFMCNQYVLRGGSEITPPGHARITYRNFFPPDARWQWSGVRLARDAR
jgi:ergothioneine biosynthesis protein EgtB